MPPLGKDLKLVEGLKKEGPHVKTDEEEEVDNGPNHVRNVLYKRRAGLKKKLRALMSPPTKKRVR